MSRKDSLGHTLALVAAEGQGGEMSEATGALRTTTRTAYRVTWKRVGYEPKRKAYRSRKLAERLMRLLGPEPWTADSRIERGTHAPDAPDCCGGWECACRGRTIREAYMDKRDPHMGVDPPPPIEWVQLEQRTVTETSWRQADDQA